MSVATVRSQFSNFNLVRSGRLNSNELAMILVIQTFSERCELTQTALGLSLNKSVSTVRRTIKSLVAKGVIDRRYTLFKRCVLRLRSLKDQAELLKPGGAVRALFRAAKKRVKSNDRSPKTELKRSPMSEPTRSPTLEENGGGSELSLGQNAESERKKALADFFLKYPLNRRH